MKLYVCYGTFKRGVRVLDGFRHPCGTAYHALRDAGHDPEVVRTYGLGLTGPLNDLSPGRREVQELTGQRWVPVLVTDDGQVIRESKDIVAWASANPARAATGAA
jgi:hypothetical protein